jgi:hypothetical protein
MAFGTHKQVIIEQCSASLTGFILQRLSGNGRTTIMLTVKRRGWAAGILFNLKTQYTNEEQIFYKSHEFKRFFKLLKDPAPLPSPTVSQ